MAFPASSSPFASKLGTNYCPRDEEVTQIRALLVEPLSRLQGLDSQIADLQKAMDKLAAERDTVGAFVAAHKALISPVRRLPLDIIQEIFVACLPTHRNCVMSAREAPVLLGRICGSWRAISITTPRLWSRLHIVEPEPTMHMTQSGWGGYPVVVQDGVSEPDTIFEEKLRQRLETTKTWLGRSGQCPLSISFQTSQYPYAVDNDPLATTRRFIQLIVPFAPRWSHVTLSTSSTRLELLDIAENDLPLLQTVEISEWSDTAFGTVQHSRYALLNAPNLLDFTFTGGHVMSVQDLPVRRWTDLSRLSIGHPLTCGAAMELLARCQQVRVCSFIIYSNGGISADEAQDGHVVEAPFLHSLHLSTDRSRDGVEAMFRLLSLPQLRHFDLQGQFTGAESENSQFIANFLSFLDVSSRFESLRIDTSVFNRSWLIQLLRGLPASTISLQIADCLHPWSPPHIRGLMDDEAIAVLTPTPENPGSCPALQELLIIRCSAPSDEALLRFLEARITLVSPSTLRKVAIKYRREKQVDIAADLQPFLSDGRLEVATISYTPAAHDAAHSPWKGLLDAPENLPWAQDDF
ncbi:hypothetical protein C8R46DRAFT_1113693 [Mycena filopes]|nr:hypothetical protein C8R46DRAFT_1113693 [Mycena filopes]